MADRGDVIDAPVCPRCGAQWGRIAPGTAMHYQRVLCGQCGRFLRWLPHPKERTMPKDNGPTPTLAPPQSPMMTDPPASPLDPPDDIPEPTVPPAVVEALTPDAPPALPDALRGLEPLMQGFLQVVQRHLKKHMDDYYSDMKSRLGAIDTEHLRLCATLETVVKLAQQAVAKAGEQNDHASYQLSDALMTLQEKGIQIRQAPYTVHVQSTTPQGYGVTFTASKEDPQTLLEAVQALVAWLAQQGYQSACTVRV